MGLLRPLPSQGIGRPEETVSLEVAAGMLMARADTSDAAPSPPQGIGRPEETVSLEVAAGLLMARAEAAAPPAGGGGPMSEADKLKRALMLALLDKQVRQTPALLPPPVSMGQPQVRRHLPAYS